MATVDREKYLDKVFDELEEKAHDFHLYIYEVEQTNQVLKKHIWKLLDIIEGIKAMTENPKIKGSTRLDEIKKMFKDLEL
jgi:hypothetical protein